MQLLRLQIKLKLRFNRFTGDSQGKSKTKIALMLFLILFVVVELGALYVLLLNGIMDVALLMEQPEALLTMILAVGLMLTLVFGIISMMSNLFYSRDIEFLASLPLRPRTVFAAKFTMTLLGEIGIMLILFIPGMIIYAMHVPVGILFFIKALLIAIAAPAIPLAIGAILVIPLMRLVGLFKNRNLAATIGTLLLFVLIMLASMSLSFVASGGSDMTNTLNTLLGPNGLITLFSRIFPPSLWGTLAIAQSGVESLLYLLLFIGVSAVMLALATMIASALYARGVAAQLESAKKRHAKKGNAAATSKSSSAFRAIFTNEWRVLLRTPTYAMNSVSMILVGPIMVVFFLLTGNSEVFDALDTLASQGGSTPLVILIGALFAALFASVNTAAATTVTREGRMFYILQTAPVPPEKQVLAKFMACYFISFAGAVVMGIVMIFMKIPAGPALLSALLAAVICYATCAFSVALDVRKPRLDWSSPQQAMKQSFNSVMSLVISWGTLGVFLLLVIFIEPEIALILSAVLSILLCVVGHFLMMNMAKKRYLRAGK